MKTKNGNVSVELSRVYVLKSILDEAEAATQEFDKLPKVIRWLTGKSFNRVMERLVRKLDILSKVHPS